MILVFGLLLVITLITVVVITFKNTVTKTIYISISISKEFDRFIDDETKRMQITKDEYFRRLITVEYEKRLDEIKKEIDEEHIDYIKKHYPENWMPPEE